MKKRYFLLPLIVPALLAAHWLWLKFSPHVRSCLQPVKIEENDFTYGWVQDSNWELFGTLSGGVAALEEVGWQNRTGEHPYQICDWKWLYEQEFLPRCPKSRPQEMVYLSFTDDPTFPSIRMRALVHTPTGRVYIQGIKA